MHADYRVLTNPIDSLPVFVLHSKHHATIDVNHYTTSCAVIAKPIKIEKPRCSI